nr:3-hydroxyisobutyryl-CoA hydrolase-like protein 1, mitochondrial [Ipomoea batatas]
MQRLKSAAIVGRFLRGHGVISQQTRTLNLPNHLLVDDPQEVVLVEGKACSRTAILNRPSALNALNAAMTERLQKLYTSWEESPDIGFVVMKGKGRAFCAGGDIVAIYNMLKQGNLEETKQFFSSAYKFMYILGTYLKPHVALLNGITMGGGAGVSVPGTFRVATDKTVFATPETLIGFHPDAGASFHLSHLPGYLGEYLGLTGDKLSGVEMMACGLATHYTVVERLHLIEEHLGNLETDDPTVIDSSLARFADIALPHQTSVMHRYLFSLFCWEMFRNKSVS